MRIEYMKYYLDFCKTKSISKTAMRYYMTPQGISRALHQLEEELDVKLFVRDGNSIVITEAGQALEGYARDIVSSYELAQNSLGKFSRSNNGPETQQSVCLVSTTCASTYLLEALKLHKRRLFPFSLRLRETNIYRICSYVERATSMLTLGLVSVPLTQDYIDLMEGQLEMHGLVMEPLICSPLSVMMSTDNPLSSKKELVRSDIENVPVVCYRDAVLLDALDDFIKEDQVLDITSNSQVLANQLREWQAVSFAPRIGQLSTPLDDVSLRILPFQPGESFFDTRFAVIGKPDDLKDERAQLFVDRIWDLLRTLQAQSDGDLFSLCRDCTADCEACDGMDAE